MAVAAKKNEYVYAPSRVYSHSRAAAAEALPKEVPQRNAPRGRPGVNQPAKKRSEAHSKTRVQRIGAAEAKKRRTSTLGKFASVVTVFVFAAAVIAVLSRYSTITSEYSKVNQLKAEITLKEQNIAALSVQLNAAITLEDARDKAMDAGLNYPTGAQIIRVTKGLPVTAGIDDTGGDRSAR